MEEDKTDPLFPAPNFGYPLDDRSPVEDRTSAQRMRGTIQGIGQETNARRTTDQETDVSWSVSPNYDGVYVDKDDPESMGYSPPFSGVYLPGFYAGMLDAATFLWDVPTMAAGYVLGQGAEALGFPETAKELGDPVLLGDIVKTGFEAPARLAEEAGISNALTRGFDATPRAPQNARERFWKDFAYISGGALSFPTSLGLFTGALKTWGTKPVKDLLSDASGRGTNSEAARKLLAEAELKGGAQAVLEGGKTSVPAALGEAAKKYSNSFVVGLGKNPFSTVSKEQFYASAAATGYGIPEMWSDKNGEIRVDLGDGAGDVDIAPSVKILASMGLPILLAHGPSGVMLAGDKTGAVKVLQWMRNKTRSFATSLIGGASESGRLNIASRIWNAMEAEPGFFYDTLLPAIEKGVFANVDGPFSPIQILDDGTVVPLRDYSFAGISPDTLQLAKQLGVDGTRLAALDNSLRNHSNNANTRLGEEARRAQRLEDTFDLLRTSTGGGDEAATHKIVEKIKANLEKESQDSMDAALERARQVYLSLEPEIGREQASQIAVSMLDGARLVSRKIARELFSKELIGTDYVDTRSLGDWALGVINEQSRNLSTAAGMGVFLKLAGRERLASIGIGETGKPLKQGDLRGAKGDGDALVTPDEIPTKGLYDVWGEAGTVYAEPIKIETLQNFRSDMGDYARAAYKGMNEKLGGRYQRIINFIDDELLVGKNFEGKVAPENIRNIEIGREYVKSAKARTGPDSEIGRILYKGDKPLEEEFLQRLIRAGSGSGRRVDLFRDALNEPQKIIQGEDVIGPPQKLSWQRDPAATLTLGDNPNVIEAELLRRFTESYNGEAVNQHTVDDFLRKYGEAVDQIPGLRGKFSNLEAVQRAADEMASKLITPGKDVVSKALQGGANAQDVANARNLNRDELVNHQLHATASNYLDAEVNSAARTYLAGDPKNVTRRAEELFNLLEKDPTGVATQGFRSALFRALRESSKRVDSDGLPIPGVNTRKLVEAIEKSRPALEKFFDRNSMDLLELEIVQGGRLQGTGTGIPASGSVDDIMAGNVAAREAAGAVGRAGGQEAFGRIGINTLAAASMGRKIVTRMQMKLGEEGIAKLLEEALRSPEKAAVLIRHFRTLPEYQVPETVKRTAEAITADPGGSAATAAADAKSRLKSGASFVQRYLQGHSRDAIERAARFGLIPAQAEGRRMTLEEDWSAGLPFVYEDNRARYAIENDPQYNPEARVGTQRTLAGQAPAAQAPAAQAPAAQAPAAQAPAARVGTQRTLAGQAPVQGSSLASANPLGTALFGANDPVFGLGFRHGGYVTGGAGSGVGRMEESGIMSVRRKPRQLVG